MYIPKSAEFKRRREAEGLSHKRLSILTGLPFKEIRRLEKGYLGDYELFATTLAEALHCNVSDIFTEFPEDSPLSTHSGEDGSPKGMPEKAFCIENAIREQLQLLIDVDDIDDVRLIETKLYALLKAYELFVFQIVNE
jgi:transcriptional regulator with XRE-family HTH domain